MTLATRRAATTPTLEQVIAAPSTVLSAAALAVGTVFKASTGQQVHFGVVGDREPHPDAHGYDRFRHKVRHLDTGSETDMAFGPTGIVLVKPFSLTPGGFARTARFLGR